MGGPDPNSTFPLGKGSLWNTGKPGRLAQRGGCGAGGRERSFGCCGAPWTGLEPDEIVHTKVFA